MRVETRTLDGERMNAQTAPMDCEQVADDLLALLDGELDGLRVEAVHGHFRACARCARFYQSLRAQLVVHRWSHDEVFDLDQADCQPEDVPDYGALAARLRDADLAQLGRLLYEILKAEFLYDYGDGVEAEEAPIADPRAERARGADLVEELRDWHDADEVDGVDLRDVARRLRPADYHQDRLDALIEGMNVVGRAAPALLHAATHYQGLAHVKAGRRAEAEAAFRAIVADGPDHLRRLARICLATLPVLLDDRPAEAIPALAACVEGDTFDALVLYNLAKAHYLAAGRRLDEEGRGCLERARQLAPELVDRQLARPSERGFREAVSASRGRRPR